MVTYYQSHIMKNVLTLLLLLLLFLCSCSDDDPARFTTYEEETIATLLSDEPDRFSLFTALMQQAEMFDLLNAYGHYTLFAPTNEAVQRYLDENGLKIDEISETDAKNIVYNHIINFRILSSDFPTGVLSRMTLNSQFLYVSHIATETAVIVFINETIPVIELDRKVHNGVIHTIDGVLTPSGELLPDMIARNSRYQLFSEALSLTGLADSLLLVEDITYEQQTINVTMYGYTPTDMKTPPSYLYGYTAFVESDSLFEKNGISNIDQLKTYAASVYDRIFPQDASVSDPTNRRNSLNRFMAYHLMNRMEASNEFFPALYEYYTVRGTPLFEYREMLAGLLLELSNTPTLGLNRSRDGSAIHIIAPDRHCQNGVFHEIDNILVYDETVENETLNKRLRMDVYSLLPELTNNKVRYMTDADGSADFSEYVYYDGYFADFRIFQGSIHSQHCECWYNLQGNEFNLNGKYDFQLRLPPIPPGTYEFRLGYHAYSGRGVTQIYLDGLPCGIPLNMRFSGSDAQIGWIIDSATEDNGVENDKMMRNRGYLKGPNTLLIANQTMLARRDNNSLRRILATRVCDTRTSHYLRFKCVEEVPKQFHLDYIEIVPIFYLEKEGKD